MYKPEIEGREEMERGGRTCLPLLAAFFLFCCRSHRLSFEQEEQEEAKAEKEETRWEIRWVACKRAVLLFRLLLPLLLTDSAATLLIVFLRTLANARTHHAILLLVKLSVLVTLRCRFCCCCYYSTSCCCSVVFVSTM